jgi:hypothetical protein
MGLIFKFFDSPLPASCPPGQQHAGVRLGPQSQARGLSLTRFELSIAKNFCFSVRYVKRNYYA